MPKKPLAPPPTSRESPMFWKKMIDASYKRRSKPLKNFEEYSRWHRGDLTTVVHPQTKITGARWEQGLENMTSLATSASMADLLFRWPRPVVRPPYTANHPQFLPALARCETTILNYHFQRAKFLRRGRRALQDALLSGMGIIKVTADPEIVIDEERLAAERVVAQTELVNLVQNGVLPRASEDQIHAIHIDIKRAFLSTIERGEIQLPLSVAKYLRQHIKIHEKMRGSERPYETIRTCGISIVRVNPIDYFFDPTTDDIDLAQWKGNRFLMRRADILENNNYDKEGRENLRLTYDRWEPRGTDYQPAVQTQGSYDIPEDLVMVMEIFDFVEQKRRLFVDGSTVALIPGEDRRLLADVQTSGPYHELIFTEDTNEAHGVSPVNSFAGEQAAASHIAAANVAGAIESKPRTLINKKDIPQDVAEQIQHAAPGAYILVDPKGNPEKKISDMFAQVPPVEVPAQNMLVKSDMIHGIERRSGLGVAKMMGGEQQNTATGAALGADASNAIAEDRGALVDAWMTDIARDVVRLTRLFVPKSQIVQVCGPDAIEAWPEPWAVSDVMNDVGVEIVPGSSRRRNTAVDQKQLLDGISAFTADPAMQGPAGTKMRLQMYRLYFEDAGVGGLDFQSVEDELDLQAMLAQAGMGGMGPEGPQDGSGGDPNAQEGPGASGPSGRSSGAPSSPAAPGGTQGNDIQQGVANVGGGRVATGAGVGDKIRLMRGGAKARNQERSGS